MKGVAVVSPRRELELYLCWSPSSAEPPCLDLPESTDVMAVRPSETDEEGERASTFFLLTQELNWVARWQTLGTHLGMTEDEITEIEQNHPGDTARRRNAMLDKWLKKRREPVLEEGHRGFGEYVRDESSKQAEK